MEEMFNWATGAVLNATNASCSPDAPEENMTGSSLIIPLVLPVLFTAGLLLRFLRKKRQSRGYMQFEETDSSGAQPSTSAAALSQEQPQTPEQESTPASDVPETEPVVDYAQPSTSTAALSQEQPQTPEQESTPASDVPETEPVVDYAQPSTSTAALSQEQPQTPEQESTPASDVPETEPVVDYAQTLTSADVSSERNPSSSPRDGPVKINPTGYFDSLYEVGKKLASKPHGTVHEGIRKSDDKQVLIKFVKKHRFDFHIGVSKPLCREAAIMRMVEHSDHVVKLYEWFDVEDHIILIMEHPGTSITLCDYIKTNGGRLDEAEAKDIMQKLIAALQYCSEQDVYHNGISLKKVLINPSTMQIKLTGFYRALSVREIPTGHFKSGGERRTQAIMATNKGLYRVLKGMVEGGLLHWKNTRLSEECLHLLQTLRGGESWISFRNILCHYWFKTPDGYMQFEEMDGSGAQTSTSADVLSQEQPPTHEQEPTPASDVPETEPVVDYAQPSTSTAALSQEQPQTPEQESTPASDVPETEPVVDYAQTLTSADVSSERNPSSSPRDGPVKINPTGSFDSLYEVGKKLASKPHGTVHEGIRKSDDKQVIIKFVKKHRFDFYIGYFEPLCRETTILWIMKHSDHVMKLYEWFDVEDHVILIMEHPGTSITLCDYIKTNGGRLDEAEAKDIMQKLITALRQCSEQDVYYKDISLRDVLINPSTMQIKLTGFYRALSVREKRLGDFKSSKERRSQALMATNKGLYRVLKGMVEGGLLRWKNTRLSEECRDLLRKLRGGEPGIILCHDWFKTPDGYDHDEPEDEDNEE